MTNDTDSPAEFSSVTMRIPGALKIRLDAAAASEGRPISTFVRYHIGKLLDERDAAESITTNTSEA